MKVTQVEAAGGKGRRLAATQSREIGGEREVAVELTATDLAFVVTLYSQVFCLELWHLSWDELAERKSE